mmetsp:Transcript_13907/g.30216  ORF Transcript_13907/g.30216 Transcript_13907/m.30216 type:complete len:232 (+) Transcript_13907:725-1420(+)
MKFGNSHHVANLGVLVSLGTKEGLSISHLNRLGSALSKSLEIAKIGTGVDKTTADGIGIAGDGTNDDDSGIFGLLHIVEEEVDKEEMSEMVNTHAHFETIIGPGRVGVLGFVDGGVANEMVQGTRRLEGLEIIDEIANGLEVSELKLHDGVGSFGEVIILGDLLRLFNVAARHDDEVTTGLGEGCGSIKTKSRRGTGDNNELASTNLEPTKNLGNFLLLAKVKLLGKLSLG